MPRSFGIFIGVNTYAHGSGFGRLRYCANDAELLNRTFGENTSVIPLRELTDFVSQADFYNALDELQAANPGADDMAVLSFAGHGFTSVGADYLAFSDSDVNDTSTCVRVADVAARLRSTGVGKSFLLLDACRNDVRRRAGIEPFRMATRSTDEAWDASIFAGCQPGQFSQEHIEIGASGNGVFSASIAEVLGSHEPIPLHELETRVIQSAEQICTAVGLDQQRPTLIAPIQLAGFDFVSMENRPVTRRERRVVLICGPTEAGKTSVGRALQERSSFVHVEMSRYVKIRHQELIDSGDTTLSRQDFVERILWGDGNFGVVADDLLADIRGTNGGLIITGARRPEEIETFIAAGLDVTQVWLQANSQARWGRMLSQNEDFGGPSRTEFIQRNLRELDWGLARVGLMKGTHIVMNEAPTHAAAVEEVLRLIGRRAG